MLALEMLPAETVERPATSAILLRDIRDPDELRACQDLQRRTWGITEDGYLLPVATMAAAQKVGGLVLGAFDADQVLVGFSFAFLGQVRGQLVLYSQLTAVDPERQGEGIGRLLKNEQRRRARDMGLVSVVWTFDPLQASNAHFNLAVLGATSRTYELDLYGSRTDALNAGLPTDRLLAEWSTMAEPAPLREASPDALELIEVEPGPDGLLVPSRVRSVPNERSSCLTVQVPSNLARLKAVNLALAIDWQLAVRAALCAAFAAGYVAVGFSRSDPERPQYLLEPRV